MDQSQDGPITWLRSLTNPTKIFPLRTNPHATTIGRADDCDIVLSAQSVSRHHCSVTSSNEGSGGGKENRNG